MPRSKGCPSFQVLSDIFGVLSVEPLALLIELLVPLVNVANVRIIHVRAPSTELGPFRDLAFDISCHFVKRRHFDGTYDQRLDVKIIKELLSNM